MAYITCISIPLDVSVKKKPTNKILSHVLYLLIFYPYMLFYDCKPQVVNRFNSVMVGLQEDKYM